MEFTTPNLWTLLNQFSPLDTLTPYTSVRSMLSYSYITPPTRPVPFRFPNVFITTLPNVTQSLAFPGSNLGKVTGYRDPLLHLQVNAEKLL